MGYLFHAYLRIVPTFADNPAWIDEDELGMGKVTMHCSEKQDWIDQCLTSVHLRLLIV